MVRRKGLSSQLSLKHTPPVLGCSKLRSYVFVLALVCSIGTIDHAVLTGKVTSSEFCVLSLCKS